MDENIDNTNINQEEVLTAEQQAAIEDLTDDEILDAFAEQMMKDKGLEELDETTFNTLKDDLKERIGFQVTRAIIARLPQDKLDQLGESLDNETATGESIDSLIASENIDVGAIARDTMLTFRDAYLGEGAEA